MSRAALAALGGWLILLACAPAPVAAHATLERTSPERGVALERPPGEVVLGFDEAVEIAFGAVRVYDQRGDRVDGGSASHPGGRGEMVAVALRDGLGEGTYIATYRVVSADSHPVAGGFVFSVGKAGTPSATVDELIDAASAGPVTEAGLGAVRVLAYLALALAVGGAAFLAAAWRPVAHAQAGGTRWAQASGALAERVWQLMLVGALLGVAASATGIAFQGAVAGGTSLWQALDATVIGDVLDTRFGTVWALRLLAWLAVAALLWLARLRRSPAGTVALALLLGFLCLTPGLAGHASTADPAWLAIAANAVHVACMGVWVGGAIVLLLALPAATRALDAAQRTAVLAATVSRFSTVALVAVAGLVIGGIVQAVVELNALGDLTGTAFGRAILVKAGLLAALFALGAWNRQRGRPRLAALAAQGEPPGAAGVALRRSLRAEGALMVTVLAVTAALVSYSPATEASGPFSASDTLGPARLELTLDPARAGRNEIHLYLFDRTTGRQYDRVKELEVSARLADKSIGPLAFEAHKAGPGHYVIRRADIAPPGDWRLDVDVRVSAFDAYTARLEVPIR